MQAFTAWVNGVLERVGEHITDISLDFSDGIKLVHFLELLSNKKIGKKLELERKTEIYRIQNLYQALQFADTQMDVKAEGVAAEGLSSPSPPHSLPPSSHSHPAPLFFSLHHPLFSRTAFFTSALRCPVC